jgi:hypothetical protein
MPQGRGLRAGCVAFFVGVKNLYHRHGQRIGRLFALARISALSCRSIQTSRILLLRRASICFCWLTAKLNARTGYPSKSHTATRRTSPSRVHQHGPFCASSVIGGSRPICLTTPRDCAPPTANTSQTRNYMQGRNRFDISADGGVCGHHHGRSRRIRHPNHAGACQFPANSPTRRNAGRKACPPRPRHPTVPSRRSGVPSC